MLGVIGENGTGKTTFINLILNKIRRDSGEIMLFGKNVLEDEQRIKEKIGVVLDESHLPETFNISEINLVMKNVYCNWNAKLFMSQI